MQPESPLVVSVLLPSYNRGRLLKEAIESLFRQTLPPERFEVVIVDNHSTDDTQQIVAEMRTGAPFEIVYRRMDRNYGCFHSLNISVEMARCEILASFDSDAWADPEWLERGLAAFGDGDDVSFVAGHIADKPGQRVRFFSLRNGAPENENIFYPSGNCFYRKSVILKFGGFDEQLAFGDVGTSPIGCADSDLAWRIKEAGLKYEYRRDVVIYHEVFNVTPMAWLRAHVRIMAVPALMARHPGMRHVLFARMFFLRDNLYFYVALAGIVAALLLSPWALVLAVPCVARMIAIQGREFSVARLMRLPAALFFLSLRQLVICGSLIYGSFRSGNVVL